MTTELAFWGCLAGATLAGGAYLNPRSPWLRGAFVVFSLAAMIRFNLWRLISAMPDFEFLLGASFAYLLCALDLLNLRIALRTAPKATVWMDRTPEVEAQLHWYGDQPPRVDVFIATYNETASVIEKTVVGAL